MLNANLDYMLGRYLSSHNSGGDSNNKLSGNKLLMDNYRMRIVGSVRNIESGKRVNSTNKINSDRGMNSLHSLKTTDSKRWKYNFDVEALHSVWSINPVNPFMSNLDFKSGVLIENHPAPFPERLVFNLVNMFSKKGDWVLDPFLGSGTTAFVALSLFRKAVGYELESKYLSKAVNRCCGKGLYFNKSCDDMSDLENDSVQLCITSPPYLHLRDYSDNPLNLCNYSNPYPKLKKVFQEVYRVLQKGSYFCLNVSDVPDGRAGGKTTFPYDLIYICKEVGFTFHESIVWDKGIRLKLFNIEQNKLKNNHEYVWVFRK